MKLANTCAEVAKLADAHGSEPCIRKDVRVRIPPSAHKIIIINNFYLMYADKRKNSNKPSITNHA